MKNQRTDLLEGEDRDDDHDDREGQLRADVEQRAKPRVLGVCRNRKTNMKNGQFFKQKKIQFGGPSEATMIHNFSEFS